MFAADAREWGCRLVRLSCMTRKSTKSWLHRGTKRNQRGCRAVYGGIRSGRDRKQKHGEHTENRDDG